MQARQDPASGQIDLAENGKPVLRYNYKSVEPGQVLNHVAPANRIYARPRSDYIHPLYGLNGEVLTKDWSPDHPHHRGIYWAWPEVDYGTNRGDLHALQNVFARPTGAISLHSGSEFAQIEAENLWLWEDHEPIVQERAIIRAYRSTGQGRVIDLAFWFLALKDEVTLARRGTAHYGGLNIRMATPASQDISVYTGISNAVPRRAWSDLSGSFAGADSPSGLTVLQYQQNPDYPGDWVQYTNLSWCQPTFPAAGTRYPLRRDQPLVLRYRLFVHAGPKPEDAQLAKLWDDLHASTTALPAVPAASRATKPNILLILADDLGFGDTSCYGATKIPTPNVDRLAQAGLRFRDAHSTSATCTPARYALLTGEYPWRKKGTGVLPGNAELIIPPGRATVASLLQRAAYRTGVVGKWHLGLGGKGGPDWNGQIKPGPREIGFDYSFIMAATGDRVPCVYLENHRVVGLDPSDPIQVSYDHAIGTDPTGRDHPELLKLHPSHGHNQTIVNGISRIGYMTGGKAARWVDEDMADTFTRKAVAFIEQNKDRPFFLYFAAHDPHVPRVPHPRFVGKSGCGVRGDAIVQFDWCVGELLHTLDRLDLARNTLVILSSDNGPVVDDGYRDGAVEHLGDHRPAGPLRGGKYSIFEGGTRVPFITRWPQRILPGVSDALVCHIDFLASFAALAGQKLAAGEGPDSRNVLPALLGQSQIGRDQLVEHARVLALRDGSWKYIEPGAGPQRNQATRTELGNDPAGQLYQLAEDLGETNNLIRAHPDRSRTLLEQLQTTRQAAGVRSPN